MTESDILEWQEHADFLKNLELRNDFDKCDCAYGNNCNNHPNNMNGYDYCASAFTKILYEERGDEEKALKRYEEIFPPEWGLSGFQATYAIAQVKEMIKVIGFMRNKLNDSNLRDK